VKPKAHVNNIKQFSSTSNKTQHVSINKIQLLNAVSKINVVYSEKHAKPTNTLCEQNAELLIVKASGAYSYHLL
jgi:hypothetical protein